jgi:dihydrofolate reductase
MVGRPGGSSGIDDAFTQQFTPGIGAEIMGANKFGPPGWHEDPDWKGWWGPNPPFHTPTFVLTHQPRPPIEMEGGTTFHFIDGSPAEALEMAREAADGQDVRLGGGPTMIREFLAAGLVDHMHVVVVPILLGRGVRLWDGLEGLEQDYRIETTSSPSGVTHINSHVRVSDHGARVHQCSRRSPSAWLTGPSVRGLSLRGRRIRRVRRPPAAVSVSPGVSTRCGGSRGRNDAP